MLAIGARRRIWTLLLLLCSQPALAQLQNETVAAESTSTPLTTAPHTTASSSTAVQHVSVTPSTPRTAAASPEPTSAFRTVNYITHTLSDQCPEPRPTATQDASSGGPDAGTAAARVAWGGIPWIREITVEDVSAIREGRHATVRDTVSASNTRTARAEPEAETETDSPLDNVNFLSFDEWKKKNLERAGQSPENVGHGRAASEQKAGRRRPVNINALDALGEESEINIDFSGFGKGDGDGTDSASAPPSGPAAGTTKAADGEDKVAPASFALSKDAGKTCKERFNYASFDCAATVLKTNNKAKSTSAVLVENKDSYMLNECSASNKFIIVELCDDILVDTVVLANYEFFSSMFRHFRVSVSDRYPVKLDRWRTLATFEARNSRDIQPFLVTEPQIWARYLRIEFLTHYGNEFYCPLSLLRVHGTTMMEQFRREEEEARGDDDSFEPIEAAEGEPVKTAVDLAEINEAVPVVQEPVETEKEPVVAQDQPKVDNKTEGAEPAQGSGPASATPVSDVSEHHEPKPTEHVSSATSQAPGTATDHSSHVSSAAIQTQSPTDIQTPGLPEPERITTTGSTTPAPSVETGSHSIKSRPYNATDTAEQDTKPTPKTPTNSTAIAPPGSASIKAATDSSSISNQPPQQRSPQQTQNPPVTQESFFKAIHKRLQSLEANSTLSLAYIEDQSRMLRDAFNAVEKRLLQKTERFLTEVDQTVINELKAYKSVSERTWETVFKRLDEVEKRHKSETGEVGVRLEIITDELVWQKRMAVVQSTLLLLCLGLVLFTNSPRWGGGQNEIDGAQQVGRKYSTFFERSPSPPQSPENSGLIRRRRTFRNMWRSDTSSRLSDTIAVSDAETDGRRSPGEVGFSSPTSGLLDTSPGSPGCSNGQTPSPEQPNGLSHTEPEDDQNIGPATSQESATSFPADETEQDQEQARRLEALATQSGPATPRGSRDAQPSWEEVDRAVDLLKAGEQQTGRGKHKRRKSKAMGIGKGKKENRSPLRRSESYNDGLGDVAADSPGVDSGDGLFGLG